MLVSDAARKPLMAVPEVEQHTGLSKHSIYRAIHRGDIPHVRIGRRILVPRAKLDAFLGTES